MNKPFKLGVLLLLVVGLVVVVKSTGVGSATGSGEANVRGAISSGTDESSVNSSYIPLLEDELPPGLSLNARVAFVRELGTSNNIISYHTKIFWPIASLTKLMTAVIAEETLGEKANITITQKALDVEGTAGNLKVGQRYTSWDLIKAMFTVSSNDAAQALALAYEKNDTGLFVQKMNEKARELGMTETMYADASGLSMVNQSTAGDLYKLVMYINQRYPDFWRVTSNTSNVITDSMSGRRQTLLNINKFSGVVGFVGGKTGHTPESGDNLISIFTYQGKQYMFLVFGAEDRFVETQKLVDWLKNNL